MNSDSTDNLLLPLCSPSQEPGVRLTPDELTDLQGNGMRNLSFEITTDCPSSCSHCFAKPAHDYDAGTISVGRVASCASEMGELHAMGVRYVSFTGGEPLLYPDRISVLSQAAVKHGISANVVTACHWASTPENARRTIDSLPNIVTWHLSTDEFHTAFVPLNQVIWAAEAAVSMGRNVVVRMAAKRPVTDTHRSLYGELRSRLPDSIPITVQGLVGSAPPDAIPRNVVPVRLCIPCGPLLRHDGTLAPCCSSLANRKYAHPFSFDRTTYESVVTAYSSWLSDPLLQLIQSVGFRPVLQWAIEANPNSTGGAASATDACGCCALLWNDAITRRSLASRATLNASRIKELFYTVFPEAPRAQSGVNILEC